MEARILPARSGLGRRSKRRCLLEADGDQPEWPTHAHAETVRNHSGRQQCRKAAGVETRKRVWKLMMKVLGCQAEELGFLPVDNREPRDVFLQANTMCSLSFWAERGWAGAGHGWREANLGGVCDMMRIWGQEPCGARTRVPAQKFRGGAGHWM